MPTLSATPRTNERELTDLELLDKSVAEDSLRDFVEQAWPILEPATPFVPGWHIDAITDHAQAMVEGYIQNLLINIPPRCAKSLLMAVFLPTWTWTRWPESRWLFASYAQNLSNRDSMKCRTIIKSDWYQRNWGDKFTLTDDQNAKGHFVNDKAGYRLASSVGGVATGQGGNFVGFDDPHNMLEALSDVERQTVLDWWGQGMTNRPDDLKKDHKFGVMQRLHQRDLSGYILETDGDNWTHLCLPMEYEPEMKCTTTLGFSDPREEEGELLWPERFGAEELATLKPFQGIYGYAGQYQQRPAPRGGGMFKRKWFEDNMVDFAPPLAKRVRYWDFAGSKAKQGYDPAWTRGAKGCMVNGIFYIEDMVGCQAESLEREQLVKATTIADGPEVDVYIEQEPGSSGKDVLDHYIRNVLQGYVVRRDLPTGNKEARADPVASQAEAGNVKMVRGDWTEPCIRELEVFPAGKHKDQADAISGLYGKLAAARQRIVW